MQRDFHAFKRLLQRDKQLAIVKLALAGQVQTVFKALAQAWLKCCNGSAVQCLGRWQFGHSAGRAVHLPGKAGCFGCVLPVPDDECAVLLKKSGQGELGYQLWPALQAMAAHAHHAGFGHGRFRQGRQHGCRSACRRARGVLGACFVNFDAVAGSRQRQRQQPAHEAGADNEHVGVRGGGH